MKKHRLDDFFTLNSEVYALFSPLPFIQLAFNLKKEMRLALARAEDLSWFKKELEVYAPVYQFYDKKLETTYSLIRNQASAGFVVPEYKKVDAFLVETNFNETFLLSAEMISKSKFVPVCLKLDVATLKPQSQQLLDIN